MHRLFGPHRQIMIAGLALVFCLGLSLSPAAARGPRQPDYMPLIGRPAELSRYWHDQRRANDGIYDCALYAQASVLEAFGFDFDTELATARALGLRDGWYDPASGATGLGQALRARGLRFDAYGTPLAAHLTPPRALARLELALLADQFVLVNVDAQALSYYHGSSVSYHTLWVTGMRLDEGGRAISVITNDSYRGPAVEYDAGEFMRAWGTPAFNYYAIFIPPPRDPGSDTALAGDL